MTWLIDRIRMWMCKHEWSKGETAGCQTSRGWLSFHYQYWHCTKCGYSKEVKL